MCVSSHPNDAVILRRYWVQILELLEQAASCPTCPLHPPGPALPLLPWNFSEPCPACPIIAAAPHATRPRNARRLIDLSNLASIVVLLLGATGCWQPVRAQRPAAKAAMPRACHE